MRAPRKNSQSPLVSVIIPAYNAEQFIAQAIQSVLNQTFRSFEIIVIDDGSTDKTKEFLQKFHSQIRCVCQKNQGPSLARNAGIKVAQGEYICFLDADDFWTPEKLEMQISFMKGKQDIALVFSDHEEFSDKGIVLRSFLEEKKIALGSDFTMQIPLQDAFQKLLIVNFISTPTVMVKKECFETTGLFDESLWSVEDRDLWLRLAAHFNFACFPRIFCKRRVHEFNVSKKSELALIGRIRVLEMNRRRFPSLATGKVWNNRLADSYYQLGYIWLGKGQRKKAWQAGLKSLGHAFRQIPKNKALSSYPWGLGIGLIPAALIGWRSSRYIFQLMKRLCTGKETGCRAAFDRNA